MTVTTPVPPESSWFRWDRHTTAPSGDGGHSADASRAVRQPGSPTSTRSLSRRASSVSASASCSSAAVSRVARSAASVHPVVAERKTEFRGQTVDLVPYILDHREQFVLKPNDEYGGKGIVLGWTVDGPSWAAAVLAALAEPSVVQERVGLPREVYPGMDGGKLQLIERVQDTNPYVGPSGTMDACLTRISTEALVNVTAGGGSTVPTFVIEER